MSDPDPSTSEFPVVERRGLGPNLYDEERHPKQRKSDHGWRYWCLYLYRNTLPLICCVVAFVGAGLAYTAFTRTQPDVERQKEGRAVAVDVLCGFGNGVAEAGVKALSGTLRGQSGNGLPQRAQRDYVSTITSSLLEEAGLIGRDVLQSDGTIDCQKLRIAAKATR